MNPTDNQNPFQDILENIQARRMENMQQATSPAQPVTPGPANAGNQNEMPQPVTAPGINNASTQALVSALSQMQNFIKASQNKGDIESAQVIISLLSQLIQQDRTAESRIQEAG